MGVTQNARADSSVADSTRRQTCWLGEPLLTAEPRSHPPARGRERPRRGTRETGPAPALREPQDPQHLRLWPPQLPRRWGSELMIPLDIRDSGPEEEEWRWLTAWQPALTPLWGPGSTG